MTEPASAMSTFVSTLLSRGLSGQDLADIIALAQAAFAGDARSGGLEAIRREKERLKKQRYRAGLAARVHGTVHGTQKNDPLTLSNNKTDSFKKEGKGEKTDVHGTTVDKPVKAKRDKGQLLPADWIPKPSHYDKGVTLGFSRSQVDFFADRMRNWAGANAHRPVARKSNWDLAFHNWLTDKSARNGGTNAKAQGTTDTKAGFSGVAARLRQQVQGGDLPFDHAAYGPRSDR